MSKDHNKNPMQDRPGDTPPRPSLTIDYDLYWKYLDNSDMSEAQKRAFLDALSSVIVSFISLGFGVHPLQQAASDKCEQLDIPAEFLRRKPGDMIEYPNQSKSQFEITTDKQSGLPNEGDRK